MFDKYYMKRGFKMEVKQIYSLINSVSKQAWGEDAPTVQDLTGIISLGREIGIDGKFTAGADKFLNALVDRIGKTVIRTLDTRLDFPNFLMDGFEFGAILQKINVAPLQAQEDNSWNIGESTFDSVYLNVYKPEVTSTLFDTITTWTCKVTIPDVLFKSAFTSESAMSSFINAIMNSLSNSIESQINKMSHIAVCNLIAEKSKNENGIIDLVSMYNDQYTAELTADTAIVNADFLRYAGYIIRNYIKYLRDESVKYNIAGVVRATARDNMHVLVLSEFANAQDTFLRSDVYHAEMVAMPLYEEVTYWQNGSNDLPTFDSVSKVNIKPSSGGDAEVVENVVCVLADRESIGTTVNERWTASDRFNSERRTNYTTGANIGWFNDLSENAIIFTLN